MYLPAVHMITGGVMGVYTKSPVVDASTVFKVWQQQMSDVCDIFSFDVT